MNEPSAGRYLALLGVAIASFLGCIYFTIVNTAIPALRAELGMSVGDAQWVVTAFVMALSATMVASGRIADLHGRRRALYAGMLLFGLGSLGAGLSQGMLQLVACRFIQGLGCSALYTASAAIVSQAFAPSERGKALGLLFAGNGLGLAIGPVAGGLLVSSLGWRWIFLINLPVLAVRLLLCLPTCMNPSSRQKARRWIGKGWSARWSHCLVRCWPFRTRLRGDGCRRRADSRSLPRC